LARLFIISIVASYSIARADEPPLPPNPPTADKGDPLSTLRTPVTGVMLNAETVAASPFVTYRNCPEGSTSSAVGLVELPPPVLTGEPTTVKAPVEELIVKVETVPLPLLATYRKLPVGSIATPVGDVPTGCGVPTSVSAPARLYE
jgi:hypothetical protein